MELLNNSASGPLDQVLDINAGVAGALAAALSCPENVGDLVLDFESVIVEKGPLAQQNVFHARAVGIVDIAAPGFFRTLVGKLAALVARKGF